MLNQAPTAVNALTRNVIVNHPNSYSILVLRKFILRKDDGKLGGKPTIGGMGELDSDDEENIEYRFIGNGYALPAEPFQGAPLVDHNDATSQIDPAGQGVRFLIIPQAQAGEEDFFTIKTHDIMYLLLDPSDDPPMMAFEIVGRESTSNIAPYTPRYICNLRNDISVCKDGTFLSEAMRGQ
jgi:hypothetical protein